MFERFTRDAREVVKRSHEEARRLRSPTIEAEHLLLALAAPASGPPAAVLADAGLDRDRLEGALDAELQSSLESIGLPAAELLEQAPPSGWRSPRWGQSAKLAMERSVRAAAARRDRRLLPAHLLLGVLRAEAGTVPRALHGAGVEPPELAARMTAAMG
jgi:ATP-dependent Clp protease ATP-binding subunit ClpA